RAKRIIGSEPDLSAFVAVTFDDGLAGYRGNHCQGRVQVAQFSFQRLTGRIVGWFGRVNRRHQFHSLDFVLKTGPGRAEHGVNAAVQERVWKVGATSKARGGQEQNSGRSHDKEPSGPAALRPL